jgi:hypothetical protein
MICLPNPTVSPYTDFSSDKDMSTTFTDYLETLPEKELRRAEVLRYTESLVNALIENYRMYSVKSHRNAIAENGIVDESYVSWHQEQLDKIREGTYDYRMNFYIVESRKFLRIEQETGVNHDGSVKQKSIHAFVDKNTGEVYKSASWKSPAKGVRYNLLDKKSREECYRRADWAGSYLYK